MNLIYRELQYGAHSTSLISEFACCLKARGDQVRSKLVYGVKGALSLKKMRPIASAEAAEGGGNPAWRHSSGVRVPTRESEALLWTRIELNKQLSLTCKSAGRARD